MDKLRKQSWTRRHGALTLLFIPFLIGCVLFYFRKIPIEELSRHDCLVLCALLVFSGACAYGLLLTPLILFLFGAGTACRLSRLPTVFPSLIGRISAVLDMFPWFPAIFCAAYLGIISSRRLLSDRIGEKGRLNDCVLTSFRQLLLITGAAVLSRMIQKL